MEDYLTRKWTQSTEETFARKLFSLGERITFLI